MELHSTAGAWIILPLSLLYIVLLLRLGAFRRDRTNPKAAWGPPADIRTFLDRDTYDARGHTHLRWVRLVLLVDIVVMAWFTFTEMAAR